LLSKPLKFLATLLFSAVLLAGCRASAPWVNTPNFEQVDQLLESYQKRGAFPGGVLAVGDRGAVAHLHPFGRLTYEPDAPPVTASTLYDLASLTKVVATTTMAMILVDAGRLDLDQPVREILPGFQGPGKDAVTVRHLLTHSSGLPAIVPLYKEVPLQKKTRAAFIERMQALDLEYSAGSRSVYSDPGIILLGEILERAAGQPLEAFVRERVFEPLGMRETMFRPPAELRSRIAPTEFDPWRGRLIQGEVHDENAFAMGGVAPHAGLFSTAGDLARFAQMLLNGGITNGRRIVSREAVELFTRRAGIPGSDRALGWDTKSAEGSSAGTLLSSRSFGHTGFTGTSIWIDPERQLFIILLTNRVHPTRENNLIREARPAVADAVVRALYPLSSRTSQARASAQSRFTVRGEQSRSAAVSSTSRPPKKRSSTTLARRGWSAARRVRASSRGRMSKTSGGAAISPSEVTSTRVTSPPRLAALRARAWSTST
jgi:CubicO group peptidase (beta-lactamase class C family)